MDRTDDYGEEMSEECKGCALLRQHHHTAWNRGFVMGKASNANAAYAASKALEAERKAHAETNVALTGEIMRLEALLEQGKPA